MKLSADRVFEIREACIEDLPALVAVHVATFKEAHGDRRAPTYALREAQWRATFERESDWFCYVAASAGGQLVGFAKGELHDGGVPGFEGELDKIYVLREWHRCGIGRALVEQVARRFLAQGVRSMLLFGDARNPSNGFYERLGAERLLGPEGDFHGGYGWRDLHRLVSDAATPSKNTMDSTFDEIWLESPDGQSLCALINGDRGWLMYLRGEGDSGFSSRDLSYTGDPEAKIEYRLNNGQHDSYPASWSLPIAEIRRALDYFAREHRQPPFISWHED